MDRLTLLLKAQLVTFASYALGWLLLPDFVNDTILGWDTDTFWPRMIGGAFVGVTYLEWKVLEKLPERLDLVWGFALIPLGFLVALIWERISGGYDGSNLFWWVSVAVTATFGAGVALLRAAVDTAKG